LLYATVGNDSSSATNGSSVASVAGKNRFPANPCAEAGSVATRLEDVASTASNVNDVDDADIAKPSTCVRTEQRETTLPPPP
jgi:hypothetical protein